MPFFVTDEIQPIELFPGTLSQLISGERLMLSWLQMQQGAVVPEHSHPHEQAGFVVEGRIRFRIGDEERLLLPGHAFVVPSGTLHAVEVVEGPARVLDIFSPPREDYLTKQASESPA